jgi:hypothetical protein
MGARRRQWMPFWLPFLTAGKGFIEYMSSSRIKLITPLFYCFTLMPAYAPLANPFGRGYLHQIGQIHQSHATGGANGSTMVVMFVDCCVGGGQNFPYYSYHRNPMGREFFIPAGTLIAVKQLTGFAFLPPFLAVRKSDFSFPSSQTYNNCKCCAWYICPHLAQVAMLLETDFLWNPGCRLITRTLLPFLALVRSFLGKIRFGLIVGAEALNRLK